MDILRIQNGADRDQIVAILNVVPPNPASFVRFFSDYVRGTYAGQRGKVARLSAAVQRWARETETSGTGFAANYLSRAPIIPLPDCRPPHGWSLPGNISAGRIRTMAGALVSAHLRILVDEWLATGRAPDGTEDPSRRELCKATRGNYVVFKYFEQSPPSIHPGLGGSDFDLEIAPNRWAQPWASNFWKAQQVTAERHFIELLTSAWRHKLCKCRHRPCGKYFVATQIRRSYRHGTYCSRAHRAHASALSVMQTLRKKTKRELVMEAALWLKERRHDPSWQDQAAVKATLGEFLAAIVLKRRNLQGGVTMGKVGVKWVTRNRAIIERQRAALS